MHSSSPQVLCGPYGSLLRSNGLEPEGVGVNERGRKAIITIAQSYLEAGATIGTTSTYGANNNRASSGKDWAFGSTNRFYLSDEVSRWNYGAIGAAKRVWPDQLFGSIASVADSSGGHDEYWGQLGPNNVDWSMQRHLAQLICMKRNGLSDILAEATRYCDEAMALARLARELKFRMLSVAFEIDEHGMPDPQNRHVSFDELKRDLQKQAGSDVEILVGANCAGIGMMEKLLPQLDLAYPNAANFPDKQIQREFTDLVTQESELTWQERSRLEEINDMIRIRMEDFRLFVGRALESGVRIVGGCCGTSPRHTKVASAAVRRFNQRERDYERAA